MPRRTKAEPAPWNPIEEKELKGQLDSLRRSLEDARSYQKEIVARMNTVAARLERIQRPRVSKRPATQQGR